MTMIEEYLDHDIEVWTIELVQGRFNWAYKIDGQHRTDGTNRTLSSDQVALKDGVAAARARVDSYRWLGTPA